MTQLLQQAFEKASHFPQDQQDALAKMILQIDHIDPEYGPIFQLDHAEYERHGITDKNLEQTKRELGLA